ncbi:hypothetical protein N9A70_00910 [Akkermansiaceae bacterium]|nr:hypothetical protein [Akkermansiaceae bacterium]MDB4566696.1 hypothetical protein [Akkermansiaceae bacterium]
MRKKVPFILDERTPNSSKVWLMCFGVFGIFGVFRSERFADLLFTDAQIARELWELKKLSRIPPPHSMFRKLQPDTPYRDTTPILHRRFLSQEDGAGPDTSEGDSPSRITTDAWNPQLHGPAHRSWIPEHGQ